MPEGGSFSQRHSTAIVVGIQVVSFAIWVLVAAFLLGGARQRVSNLGKDMEAWKAEWKEKDRHITTMDLEGSVATKNFVKQYEAEQAKQYERLHKLEIEVAHLETMNLKIDRLEQKVGDGKPRP